MKIAPKYLPRGAAFGDRHLYNEPVSAIDAPANKMKDTEPVMKNTSTAYKMNTCTVCNKRFRLDHGVEDTNICTRCFTASMPTATEIVAAANDQTAASDVELHLHADETEAFERIFGPNTFQENLNDRQAVAAFEAALPELGSTIVAQQTIRSIAERLSLGHNAERRRLVDMLTRRWADVMGAEPDIAAAIHERAAAVRAEATAVIERTQSRAATAAKVKDPEAAERMRLRNESIVAEVLAGGNRKQVAAKHNITVARISEIMVAAGHKKTHEVKK